MRECGLSLLLFLSIGLYSRVFGQSDPWILRVSFPSSDYTTYTGQVDGNTPNNVGFDPDVLLFESTTGVVHLDLVGYVESQTECGSYCDSWSQVWEDHGSGGSGWFDVCDHYTTIYCPIMIEQTVYTIDFNGQLCSNPDGISQFYKKIFAPVPVTTCGGVTLTTQSTSTDYVWEVTDNPNDPSHWKTIVSKNSKTINLSIDDLTGLDISGNLFARVKDPSCNLRVSNPSAAFRIYYPAPLFSASTNPPSCNGGDDGTISVNLPSGNLSGYKVTLSYNSNIQFQKNITAANFPLTIDKALLISNNQSSLSGIVSGDWDILIQNNDIDASRGDCGTTTTYSVPITPKLISSISSIKPVKCFGETNGEVEVTISGGALPFTYSMSDLPVTPATGSPTNKPIFTGLIGDTYTFKCIDSKNCEADNLDIIVPAPQSLLSPTISILKNISCFEKSDGQLQVNSTGGVSGYSYQWSDFSTSQTIKNLGEGNYSVLVTDSYGCQRSAQQVLTKPLQLDFDVDIIKDLACSGDLTGVLQVVNIKNSQGAPSYLWSTAETNDAIFNVGAGTYSMTLTDGNGCKQVKSKTLINPPAYSVAINPISDFNGSHIKCNGDNNGELAALVKDASNVVTTAQYYLWSKDGSTVSQGSTLASINSLDKGSYTVSITYNTSCKIEATYVLNEPSPVDVTILPTSNYNGQRISCHNKTDASLKATATGGTIVSTPYDYTWNTGMSGSLVSDIGAGNYRVDVTDNNGCVGTKTITLIDPDPVEALITNVSDYSGYGVSCYGLSDGSITVAGSGGTGVGYSYSWSNGKLTPINSALSEGSYTVEVSDNNGCKGTAMQAITAPVALSLGIVSAKNISCYGGSDGKITLSASGGVAGSYKYTKDDIKYRIINTFDSLAIGNFTFTIQDRNGCNQTTSTSLTEPTQLSIAFTDVQPAFCNNPQGSATALVTGGVSSYDYSWMDSDLNVVSTTNKLSGVKGNVYSLTIHDGNNCSFSSSVGITSTDGAKSTYNSTDAKCFDSSDGSALITITQGDGPFVIQWPDGQSELQGINLKKNTYSVKITDAHSCTVIQSVVVSAPDVLQLTKVAEIIPTCNAYCDGSLTLQGGGGAGGYVYDWNGKPDAQQSQLCSGTYAVTLKDVNQCVLYQDVVLSQPDVISLSVVNEKKPTCKDGCDGELTILASGGNGGYQYTWSEGGSGATQSNLCPNNYSITIKDKKGCLGTGTTILHNAEAVPLDLGGGVTLCVGQHYKLDAGNWPNIQWTSSTGFASTDEQITIQDPGSYWLEVINDKGCVGQDTFLLETSFDLLKASFMIPKEAEVEDTVVMIDISYPLPESITWTYPSSMKKILDMDDVVFGQFLDPGSYEISLTAHLGECVDQVSKTITILNKSDAINGGRLGYEDFVKTFTLHPSPNDGTFSVGVELLVSSSITLSVWNGPTGVLLKQVSQADKSIYEIDFDLRPLSSGIYILRLDHLKGKEYIRFMVN